MGGELENLGRLVKPLISYPASPYGDISPSWLGGYGGNYSYVPPMPLRTVEKTLASEMAQGKTLQKGVAPQAPPATQGPSIWDMRAIPGVQTTTQSGIRISPAADEAQRRAAQYTIESAKAMSDADKAQATAERQAYGDIGAERKAELGRLDARARQIEAERDRVSAEYRAQVEAARAAEPNPDRWWSSQSAGQKALVILANVVGYSAAAKGGRNLGAELVKEQIEGDMVRQEKLIERGARERGETRNMLADLTQRLGDVDAAKANLRVRLADDLQERLQLAALNTQDARSQGQLLAAQAAVEQAQAEYRLKRDEMASAKSATVVSRPEMYEVSLGKDEKGKEKKAQLTAAQMNALAKAQGTAAKAGAGQLKGKLRDQADAAESFSLKALDVAKLVKKEGVKWGGAGKFVKDTLLGGLLGSSQTGVAENSLFGSMAAQEMRSQGLPPSGELYDQKKKDYFAFGIANNNEDVANLLAGKIDQQIAILEGMAGTAQAAGNQAELQTIQGKLQNVRRIKAEIGLTLAE